MIDKSTKTLFITTRILDLAVFLKSTMNNNMITDKYSRFANRLHSKAPEEEVVSTMAQVPYEGYHSGLGM